MAVVCNRCYELVVCTQICWKCNRYCCFKCFLGQNEALCRDCDSYWRWSVTGVKGWSSLLSDVTPVTVMFVMVVTRTWPSCVETVYGVRQYWSNCGVRHQTNSRCPVVVILYFLSLF
jgi:hypothetical protein